MKLITQLSVTYLHSIGKLNLFQVNFPLSRNPHLQWCSEYKIMQRPTTASTATAAPPALPLLPRQHRRCFSASTVAVPPPALSLFPRQHCRCFSAITATVPLPLSPAITATVPLPLLPRHYRHCSPATAPPIALVVLLTRIL